MLKRKVYQELLKWKENTGGKARDRLARQL